MITKPSRLVPGLVGLRGSLRATYVGKAPTTGYHLVSLVDIGQAPGNGSYALDTVLLDDSQVMAYAWSLPVVGNYYLDSVMREGTPSPTKNPRARQVNHYVRALDGAPTRRIASAVPAVSHSTYRPQSMHVVEPIQATARLRLQPASYQRPSLAQWNRRAAKHAQYWEG